MHRNTAIVVLLLFAFPTAVAATTTFVATINGASNVPPLDVPGTGSAIFVLNEAQTQLSFNIEYDGLLGDEIASHIHNAGARDNGPIAFDLALGSPKTGVWNIPPDMVTELLAKRLYVNIHSSIHVGGELRGNIVEQEVPVDAATWSRIKALYRAP